MTQNIINLLERLSKLPKEDLLVLRTLSSDNPLRPVEISAELYILPSDVTNSIERLSKNGFVEKVEPSRRKWLELGDEAVKLSSEGIDAQTILPLLSKGESE